MQNVFGQSFAAHRTEDDILSQKPLLLFLGKEHYEVASLTFNKNREWRGKMAAKLNELTSKTAIPMDSMQTFMLGFMAMFFEFPETVAGLIFEYAPELPREKILDEATDEQIVVAFSRVMTIAYPFFGLLNTMQAVQRAAQKKPE